MEVILCDICERRENVNRISYSCGKSFDGAGGYDIDYEVFDLCNACEISILRSFVKQLKQDLNQDNWQINKSIIAIIRRRLQNK